MDETGLNVLIAASEKKEPVIFISRLLLCMRRMYVANIRFGLPLRMNGMHKTQFDHAHFDLLPLVI